MSDLRRQFHVTLHPRPAGSWQNPTGLIDGVELQVLEIPSAELQASFPISFETFAEFLSSRPRLFFEPDGSFVWVSTIETEESWQLDGMLYDRDGKLLYVELKGTCSAESFDELLGGLQAATVMTLVRHALTLDAEVFRQHFLTVSKGA